MKPWRLVWLPSQHGPVAQKWPPDVLLPNNPKERVTPLAQHVLTAEEAKLDLNTLMAKYPYVQA